MQNLSNTIRGAVSQLIGVLNTRNRDIITRRFGLKSGKRETLESIGQSYGITRERVRQIEEASLKQVRENYSANLESKIKPFITLAENILEQGGGIMKESDFFEKFSGNGKETSANASLVLFLVLDSKLGRVPESDDFYSLWSLSDASTQTFYKTISSLIGAFDVKGEPVAESAVVDFYKKSSTNLKDLSPATIHSYISVSKNISKNDFGEVGLISWPDIKPRGVKDRAFMALKREGKPKHFREIAQLINTINLGRKANVQTVHNELIKDGRFVLVGRGLYGLAEWGYKAGTVKDVLVDLLKSAGKPLHRDEIVAQVMSHRMVKKNTIVLNLQNSKFFNKKDDGTFSLKQL